MEEPWVRSIQRQCGAQNVPFFFKQWGGVQKGKAGRTLGNRTWDEFPGAATDSRRSAPRRPHRLAVVE